ncbi:MAG: hypothetical protein Kow00106_11070 [Anaerolineae bacterium]
MKPFHKVTLLPIVVGLSLATLSLAPTGPVSAQGGLTPTPIPLSQDTIPGASPTPGAGGGLLIPTSTPEPGGGLLIPTNTPAAGGGLLIPTSTPAGGLIIPTSTPAPAEPSFPTLTDVQLQAINLQPADVPADFAANQEVKTFTAEGMIADLNNAGASELAEAFQQITATYGWQFSVGITYTSCQPNVPINEIYSEVGQFSSPSAGRRFFDDPQVQDFFTALGYSLTPAENVHGWRATYGPDTGACFPQETEYAVFFEYWGLMLTVSMTANANTDPQLVWSLVDQLIPIVIAHADAQATQPFPATPTPGGVVLEPTPVMIASTPVLPVSTPVVLPPTPTAPRATLQDLAGAMPTMDDLGMDSPPWAPDQTLSGIYTLDQLVALFQTAGLNDLALATQNAAQRSGLIGQVSHLWSTGTTCGDPALLDVEISVALFNDPEGPALYMNDAGVQRAWLSTGLYSSIMPHDLGDVSGQLWIGSTTFHRCGGAMFRNIILPHGRFLVMVSLTASASASPDEVIDVAEELAGFTADKLDQAGLQ